MGTAAERIDTLADEAVAALRDGNRSVSHVRGARGAGKSWALQRLAERLSADGVRVLRTAGDVADQGIAFASFSTLVRPVVLTSADEWPALRAAIDFGPGPVDPVQVATEAHRLLSLLASAGPLALVVDDAHLLDTASADTLSFVARRVDALTVVTAGTEAAPHDAAVEVRVGEMDSAELVALLQARGVAKGAADACAASANGNPGLALALADGLSPQQRTGDAPVAALPRPAGGLADELLRRLRAHGDRVSRALVVAAAEPGGDGAAVRAALETLGESGEGLDAAEEAGLLEVVGTRVLFPDPWTRSAAYHLVAPASRRAAHRALAAAFAEPGQAAQRAWHLAAGADGPSGAVTEALLLLADDTARRGAVPAAAAMAERAAEFAPDDSTRTECLLSAVDRWIECASVDGIRRVAAVLDRSGPEAAAAWAESDSFLRGDPVAPAAPEGSAAWATRRTVRLQTLRALDEGDHRAVLASPGHGDPRAFVAAALAHRHAGRLQQARQELARAALVLEGSDSAAATWAQLAAADLDVLQGRADDALASLALLPSALPAAWAAWAAAMRARAGLALDPSLQPLQAPAAFAVVGSGPLAEIRSRVADGLRTQHAEPFEAAWRLADEHQLPVEGAEARMWASSIAGADPRLVDLAVATLQRCGSRGWEPRLRLPAPQVGTASAPTDPALDSLSQAERRVAEAVARGLTNREVADHLYLSVKTVDFHLQQMYRKLGIRSRTELAVRMAGYVPPTTGDRR
ncbi:MAG: LuxR C-terminal-related transcriptional regulator [Actinomycetota bacterium]